MPELLAVRRAPGVWHLVSTVSARVPVDVPMSRVVEATFPPASVTGTPKARDRDLLSTWELRDRGIYCGTVGFASPLAGTELNVAIRTVMLEADGGEMGIGSGIVADSKADAEFEECLLKAQFLTRLDAPFALIETIRYERGTGFHLLERHLARLQTSAAYFGYPFAREDVLQALDREAALVETPVAMLRFLLAEDGTITVTSTAIQLPTKNTVWRFVISDQRLDEKDPFFYHKTTRRQFYDREMERQKALTGCDEVVFLNKKGELTEGTRTNLFVELDGRLFTPALTCGLLPGTLREELLDLPRAAASEAVLSPQDLLGAERIYLGNSVRGLVRAELSGSEQERSREPADTAAAR